MDACMTTLYASEARDSCWGSGLAFCSTQLSTQVAWMFLHEILNIRLFMIINPILNGPFEDQKWGLCLHVGTCSKNLQKFLAFIWSPMVMEGGVIMCPNRLAHAAICSIIFVGFGIPWEPATCLGYGKLLLQRWSPWVLVRPMARSHVITSVCNRRL